jgi:hypothetical protein
MNATINNQTIDRAIKSFPAKGDWKCKSLSSLRKGRGNIAWEEMANLRKKGGVYAWSFPRRLFVKNLRIALHGPKNTDKVMFHFSATDLPAIANGRMVLYVGRATDLLKRVKQHLRPSGRTSFQVGKGLRNCGLTKHECESRDSMLEHVCFHYHIVDGNENVVNRDLIEAGLVSKYRAPFNVKAEH